MSIEDRLQVVKLAELDCETRTVTAANAWKDLKRNFKHASTPWRIVTVGALSGFLMGRSGGPRGDGVGAKLFGTVAQALITTLGASATAGMAAGAAADAAATATVAAVADGAVTPESRIAAAKPAAAAARSSAPAATGN